MIIEKNKKGNTIVYYVDKDYEDSKLFNVLDKKLKREQIKTIIDHDADVYTKEGNLLLRFRKNKLNNDNVDAFYNNVIKFALNKTRNRGSTTGTKKGYKNVYNNVGTMSNILGYFDKFTPMQKFLLRNKRKKFNLTARETRFNMDYPDKFKKLVPLIKEIDKYYEEYIPENYGKQRKKANQTTFKIDGTAFTTVTTNVNFQTAVHTDKGDDSEGFGNLVVIEHGKYKGGETCFPQYGIGIDVRSCDILYMDVHQAHGNLPIILDTPDAKRLSVVCYLRKNIWEQTRGKTKKFMIKHNKSIRNLRKSE
jgi:hypothetical protein